MADSSPDDSNMAAAKTVISTAASLAATAMVARSIARDLLPCEIQAFFFSGIRSFFNRFSPQLTMVIDEFDGLVYNQIYLAAEIYLGSKVSPNTQTLKVSKPAKERNFTVTMGSNEKTSDVFIGVRFDWIFVCRHVESENFHNPRDLTSTLRSELRSFQLSFHKKHKGMVLNAYLPYIVREAKSMMQESKTLKIFTVSDDRIFGDLGNMWTGTILDHPATFDTLAMDPDVKNFILKDLKGFVRRKEYYRKVGKAWKRGYLLYGPPGTGKSSLIAAMANYLKFDIYDLELTELQCNSELRRLLITMANRSILVVEDIDCSIEFQDRMADQTSKQLPYERQVTLSGLLNFVDGLWSSCGDERIVVFTTNHKEKLDQALLWPGRMDVNIHMPYCTPCGFRILASNFLGTIDHQLFDEILESIETTKVTPAEVAEQLIKNEDPDMVLKGLIEFLNMKMKDNEKVKAQKQSAEKVESVEDEKVESDYDQGYALLLKAKAKAKVLLEEAH
ncbi:AAA-ATPase At3g50940-like [Carya illinoinensis]|uniref:AAA+ ATPase domain-containing protein n=1 Tax=Carya illinoinensis TaxID=32201 RepID=A0A8T1PYW6_CARIL|nr:AAA-ATPase At3g50940-like [Carya illinoinensis]KAG6647024.1 hypothetical protein CIPAW_07G049800 [Carya illinoinensis]